MKHIALIFALVLPFQVLRAGDATEDWQALVALDAGPQQQAKTKEEARGMAVQHLVLQERALRNFVTAYPNDAHNFEARLRLVRLLEIRGGFESSEKARAESQTLLDALEKTATPEQRVELDFARVTRLMRKLRQPTPAQRGELLSAVRGFQMAHAGDRRIAALLVEVATLFDAQPKQKIELLTDAAALTSDPQLKGRIDDDQRRTALLGQPVVLQFTSVQGPEVKVEDYRGKLVFVVFFADFSPPSMEALARLQAALTELPKGKVAGLAIGLDPKKETATAALKQLGIDWPLACDERGWQGTLVRSFGINALPTVWLLDQHGRLRALNALGGATDLARSLLRE